MATPESDGRQAEGQVCSVCHGTGEVARPVRVGRKRRVVGEQSGLCLNCLGSGQAPD